MNRNQDDCGNEQVYDGALHRKASGGVGVGKKWSLAWVVLAFLLSSCAPPTVSPTNTPAADDTDLSARIKRVENGLIRLREDGQVLSERAVALEAQMKRHKVPGVSVAVFNDYQIEWAKGYDVLEAGTHEPVTPESLFNAGSVLKPVVAGAALALVEDGLLELDHNVNDRLLSWQVPENEFTAKEKVTLRRLLSHSAGLTDGFTNRSSLDPEPGYVAPAGVAPTVSIPQMLDAEPGVDVDGPTRVTMVPGTAYRYANADYAILGLLMADVAQKPSPGLVKDTVLRPLGMTSSTLEQPLPKEFRDRATSEHYANGQPFEGKRHHYPIGGLWTTPSDLARFAIEIMLAYRGQSEEVISQEMAVDMLSPQIDTPDERLGDSYGFGFHLEGEGKRLCFFHTGGTWGSTCILWAYPETGQGAVVMTNSASNQGLIRFEILFSIAAEYGWP
jgi:CubicO group peptidase (beta-lactamase class C family)